MSNQPIGYYAEILRRKAAVLPRGMALEDIARAPIRRPPLQPGVAPPAVAEPPPAKPARTALPIIVWPWIPGHEPSPGSTPKARRIRQAVCELFELRVAELDGHHNCKTLGPPRQMAMALLREHCPLLSLPQIGRVFGGRDHTTVLHACRRHAERMERSADYRERVAAVLARV